jgi:Galactose oxidase, central domain
MGKIQTILIALDLTVGFLVASTSLQAALTSTAVVSGSTTTVVAADPISYQGRLSDSGSPASGSYDFQFTLKDAASAGNTLGEAIKMTLSVQSGVFSASLPWSPSLFPGSARWIEVQVRPTPSSGSAVSESEAPYSVLERQRIQSTPYALRSLTSATVESVPVQSLPASVPLIGSTGKLDSTLLASDIARSSEISVVAADLKATQVLLTSQIAALAQENALLKQSVQVLSAPTRSGWMSASFSPTDADLVRDGFSLVSTVPAPDWKVGSLNSAPTARFEASSVWTGQEWIVWGGVAAANRAVNTGARYRPDLDLWSNLSTLNSPSERSRHSAVWTGKEMIVWGGVDSRGYLSSGAKYLADDQAWGAVTSDGAPSARAGHSSAWTGRYMVIFGGQNNEGITADAYLYDPAANKWTLLPMKGSPPEARIGATMIWTGSALIVWGGKSYNGYLASGAILTFDAQGVPGEWAQLATPSGISGRVHHASVWDGQHMMIWGGLDINGKPLGDGAVFDFATRTWATIPPLGAPTPRFDAAGVWTGEELVVFGGKTTSAHLATATGAAWRPGTGWRPLSLPVGQTARANVNIAWTGSLMLVFGGESQTGLPVGDLQRLEVRTPWYLYRRGPLSN